MDPLEAQLDPSANPALRRGVISVESEHDLIAKVHVRGLDSSTKFVFAFVVLGTDLDFEVGETKTAPESGTDTLRIAVFQCSDFANGYFHTYDIALRISDLDLWIHSGDYVYEYGNCYDRPSPERNKSLEPLWEQVSLQDYGLRFTLYRDDEGLVNLVNIQRKAPVMATWDDHESTSIPYAWNGVNGTGAQKYQPECAVHYRATDAQKSAAT